MLPAFRYSKGGVSTGLGFRVIVRRPGFTQSRATATTVVAAVSDKTFFVTDRCKLLRVNFEHSFSFPKTCQFGSDEIKRMLGGLVNKLPDWCVFEPIALAESCSCNRCTLADFSEVLFVVCLPRTPSCRHVSFK